MDEESISRRSERPIMSDEADGLSLVRIDYLKWQCKAIGDLDRIFDENIRLKA